MITSWSTTNCLKARENIIGVVNVWIFFNNIRIPAFFTNSIQSLPFSNHIYLIAWPVLGNPRMPDRSQFTLTHFTAAQNQHQRHQQSTAPRYRLCHRS
ncbi:hypothetical protein OIU76_013026 [Salix suchowensis]|uniref:Uncharacterized protein n=1 Tax=Salix suchowensis TaxID=1278906 RepID=A0ABQ9A518_9ROSI|nr:hypothetical protein OIU76_013026 [Salix suchowensis]KAJ6323058.1 hypothetical protein OIU77_012813 [Salix suchowensis]